jgi:hypothetical protein
MEQFAVAKQVVARQYLACFATHKNGYLMLYHCYSVKIGTLW